MGCGSCSKVVPITKAPSDFTHSSNHLISSNSSGPGFRDHHAPTGLHPRPSVSTVPVRPLRNVEGMTVVWLDAQINKTNDNESAKMHLRATVNSLQTFEDFNECVAYLNSITDTKIFLIVSGSLGQQLVPLVHSLDNLNSIYIFCLQQQAYENLAKDYRKIKGVFTSIDPICQQLRKDMIQVSNDDVPISVAPAASSTEITEGESNNQQRPEFMYAQLLQELLLKSECSRDARQIFVDYCRIVYEDNYTELQHIDELEQFYERKQAVWWYSQPTFLYKMLNEALLVQDVDILYKIRFFIQDLHQQLEQIQIDPLSPLPTRFTVYRGLGLSNDIFATIKINRLISFNTFLSTSRQKAVAIEFASPSLHRPGFVSVLFEMEINTENARSPFADVQYLSAIEREKEVLFSMGTVFRIRSISKLPDGMWLVGLTLTSDHDEQLRRLSEQIRRETGRTGSLDNWSRLMERMGKYESAEYFAQLSLQNESVEISPIQYIKQLRNLGLVYVEKGEYERALAEYQRALDIYHEHALRDDDFLARLYHAIASLKSMQGDYDDALRNYQTALKIMQQSTWSDTGELANLHGNMGILYNKQDNYSKAHEHHKHCLELLLQNLPANHPTLASAYNNIGMVYNNENNYEQAYIHYMKALDIDLCSRPANHPSLAIQYNNIALVLYQQKRYAEAISNMAKAVEISNQTLSPNHPLALERLSNLEFMQKEMNRE